VGKKVEKTKARTWAERAKAHIREAERNLKDGWSAFRNAAKEMERGLKEGSTQADVAKAIGKSESWVSRVMTWHREGGKARPPFAMSKEQTAANKKVATKREEAERMKRAQGKLDLGDGAPSGMPEAGSPPTRQEAPAVVRVPSSVGPKYMQKADTAVMLSVIEERVTGMHDNTRIRAVRQALLNLVALCDQRLAERATREQRREEFARSNPDAVVASMMGDSGARLVEPRV
jgi:hypothetical protein